MKYRKTKCTVCGGGIEFPSYGTGQTVECPHCGGAILLPKKRSLIRWIVWGSLALFVFLPIISLPIYLAFFFQGTPQETADAKGAALFSVGGLLVMFGLLAGYFLPSVVATARHHRNTLGICLINFFLGWTILGWVAALVWACYIEKTEQSA